MLNRAVATALGAALCSAIVLGANAQNAPPPEPIVYSDIQFPELPYASSWIEVDGATMHYIEGGDPNGDPILFIHGNPTWSYLWRNIMPLVESEGRVIAIDLIGFGRSDKPDIAYRYEDHRRYLNGFIEALDLQNLTLVVHDWGSGLGFDYAATHPDNVKAVAFMEAMIPPIAVAALDQLPEAQQNFFTAMRTAGVGEELVLNQNFFVEVALNNNLPQTDGALDPYRAPFPTPESRLPILVWPRQIPFG